MTLIRIERCKNSHGCGALVSFSRFSRYFSEVARLGSIRKASESLHVSASAIDRQILNAEAELGVPLFERLPGGLRLTAAGEILMASTGKWEKDYALLLDEIADLEGPAARPCRDRLDRCPDRHAHPGRASAA